MDHEVGFASRLLRWRETAAKRRRERGSARIDVDQLDLGAGQSRRKPADQGADDAGADNGDPVFDLLLCGETDFSALPELMALLAASSAGVLCHTVRYD